MVLYKNLFHFVQFDNSYLVFGEFSKNQNHFSCIIIQCKC